MSASREKKDAVLRAIGYELDMLAAAPVMRTTAIVIDPNVSEAQRRMVEWSIRNTYLEGPVVHVRNLVEFFYRSGSHIGAASYVKKWSLKAPDASELLGENVEDLYADIRDKLSHIGSKRAERREWDVKVMADGMIETALVFESHLNDHDRRILHDATNLIAW
jgi:hypothetical protein